MAAICNGMSLSKVRPFGSGFFIFSDYARGSIRLSALMELPVIHIFTHDSIGVGEDGPTHQPVEQLASLRAIPDLMVMRPARRQRGGRGVARDHAAAARAGGARPDPPGAAHPRPHAGTRRPRAWPRAPTSWPTRPAASPRCCCSATGSEVALCVEAYEQLAAEGVKARVVSMPSWELFEQQPQEYRDSVLPPGVRARVAVEQASTFGWERYTGIDGALIGMQTFGASAPLKELHPEVRLHRRHVVAAAKAQIARARGLGEDRPGGRPLKVD